MGGEARPHPVPSPNRLKRGHWHIEGDGGYPEATTVEDAEVAAAFFFSGVLHHFFEFAAQVPG